MKLTRQKKATIQGECINGEKLSLQVLSSFDAGAILLCIPADSFFSSAFYLVRRHETPKEMYFIFYVIPRNLISFYYHSDDGTFFWNSGKDYWVIVPKGRADMLYLKHAPAETLSFSQRYGLWYNGNDSFEFKIFEETVHAAEYAV